MSIQIDQIKERLNIVDVVAGYVKLTKAGKNYKALSPFKKEKTPSFYVSPDKGMYYDFSSGQGGDIFTFVQAMEGVDFGGALKILAERAGVELVRESPKARDARERMFGALEEATAFFETNLAQHAGALAYLRKRGLEDLTIRRFRLGFAPAEWSALHGHLTGKHYSEAELEQVGLIKKGEKGSFYDRFRSRIIFPISDTSGRVIGFSGRIFGEAAEDTDAAKYLNSPETPLFDKSRVLYGYDKAKGAIRHNDFSILVEGQMDIVLSHQAGFQNTVAVSGTGLTNEHLALILRLTQRLVLAFDADSAGVRSLGRAAALALPKGMDVKVARLPSGVDPADLIQQDKELWRKAVREGSHVVDFFISTIEEEAGGDSRKFELRARDVVLPLISLIESRVDQAHFVKLFAERLRIPEEAVWDDLRRLVKKAEQGESREQPAPSATRAERPGAASPTQTARRTELERSLAGFLFWQNSEQQPDVDATTVEKRLRTLGLSLESELARHEGEKDMLTFQAELLYGGLTDVTEVFQEMTAGLARERMLEERSRLAIELKEKERNGESEVAAELLERFNNLSLQITELEVHD